MIILLQVVVMLLSVGFEGAVARMGKGWERQKFKSKDEVLSNFFQETGIISEGMIVCGRLGVEQGHEYHTTNMEVNHQIF